MIPNARRAAALLFLWIGTIVMTPTPPSSAQASSAQDPNPGAPSASAARPPWTVDDLIQAQTANGWQVSRDGRWAVWVLSEVREVDDAEKRVSNLWLGDLASGESFALTRGNDTVAAPAFSPDGRHVAFLSDRALPAAGKDSKAAKRQLWALPLRGGEAFPLTRFERDVQAFGWRGPETLVAVAQETASAWESERKEQGDTAVVVDDYEHEPAVRLFRVTLDGKSERLSHNRDWIDTLRVSPDGSRAVVRAQQSLSYDFDQKKAPKLFLVDLDSGAFTGLLTDSGLVPGDPAWQPDSKAFYFVEQRSRHPQYRMATVSDLYRYDLEAGRAERIDLGWERGLGGSFLPLPDGFLALLSDGVRNTAARYRRAGGAWKREALTGAHVQNLDNWDVALDGSRVVYAHSTANTPPQGYTARLEGARLSDPKVLTKLNPGFAAKDTGRVEVITWAGAGGDSVEGLLHYPLGWRDGADGSGPAALVVDIHGGPAAADRDSWDQRWSGPLLLWRQRGAFILQVNYHGSSDYGLDWVESIEGRYYEQERDDILRGVDHLIERGLVDPKRLGCAGWSNGGILTADLITATDRFRAASVGAADIEWLSDWANVDFGAAFDNYYFGGPPWERLEHYVEKSPFFRLGAVETPTIVFTGTEDRNVPPHQSWSLFRALQYLEKAPVRLVLFPGEPHGLQKIAHQRRKVEEEMAWFDRYLFEHPPTASAVLPDGSLLAGMLARRAAAADSGALGVRVGAHLVPETVLPETAPAGGIEVGRFEVTRAQWAAFDGKTPMTAGSENLPVTGITFDRAQRYAAWLAEITGRPFRLPTVDEAKALGELASEVETAGNTLDLWVGYGPNPEDTETLRVATAGLGGDAPLLLPVGSRGGAGRPPVFDLDGNAAEWAVGPGGKGVAQGASADQPRDAYRPGATNDASYIGLRVVVGPPPSDGA